MKKFHLEIDIIENYCDNCNYRDENTCAHPDAKEGNRIENGFDVMIEIPDWCPLPDYNEQVQHFMNAAISFGRK
jgi:hypothetical protein